MKRRFSKRLWIAITGLLALYLLVGIWTTKVQSKPLDIPGSTYASGPHGTMAIERTWQQLNLPWSTWEQIPDFLPKSSNTVFVSVQPQTSIYQKQDIAALRHFAGEGNTVIWVTSSNDLMLKQLHAVLQPLPSETVTRISTSHGGAAWSSLSFQASEQLGETGLQHARKLMKDQQGHILGAVFRQGAGRIIIFTAPSVWENGTIGKADNFQFVWTLIGNHKVFWDEYGHGYSSQNLVGWMFHGPSVLALVLLIAALLLYIYQNLWRFGPVRNPEHEDPMLGTDFMDALAWHLQKPVLRQAQYEQLVPLVQMRLAQHRYHRGVATIDAASQWIESRSVPELTASWQAWMRLADAEYQPKRWREFLKLTRTLLRRAEEYNNNQNGEKNNSHGARAGYE